MQNSQAVLKTGGNKISKICQRKQEFRSLKSPLKVDRKIINPGFLIEKGNFVDQKGGVNSTIAEFFTLFFQEKFKSTLSAYTLDQSSTSTDSSSASLFAEFCFWMGRTQVESVPNEQKCTRASNCGSSFFSSSSDSVAAFDCMKSQGWSRWLIKNFQKSNQQILNKKPAIPLNYL